MTMLSVRAAVLHEPGRPMSIEEVGIRKPDVGEVLVRTASVGICGTDLHFAAGRFPYPVPTVLGHEASGVIEQIGPGVVGHQPGDRVLVCDQMPCGQCGNCLSGRMVYCTDTSRKQRQKTRLSLAGRPVRQYLGVSALAELMLVDAAGLVAIPDDISFTAAALLGCCLTTGAATIFNTADTRPGDTVLIIGCGGVGLGAIQAARIAGAGRIIAADPEPHRAQAALEVGATDVIDPTITDLVDAVATVTAQRGVDVALEIVGDPALAEAAFASLASGGRAIVIGMMPADGRIALPAALLRHGRSMAGSVMGEVRIRRDIPMYLQMVTSGRIVADRLATSTWPLDQINDAFDHAAARQGIRTMIEF